MDSDNPAVSRGIKQLRGQSDLHGHLWQTALLPRRREKPDGLNTYSKSGLKIPQLQDDPELRMQPAVAKFVLNTQWIKFITRLLYNNTVPACKHI